MRVIAVEEAFATPAFLAGPGQALLAQAAAARDHPQVAAGLDGLLTRLGDLGAGRIADMDAAGVDLQVLSLTAPGVEQLDPAAAVPLAREINDRLAVAVAASPTRFAGLATVPTPAPPSAATELERAATELGLSGALINGHSRGRYLDDDFFRPILEALDALRLPLYLHPTLPTPAMVTSCYFGNYPSAVAGALAGAAWGWHVDTALHVLRLILSGAFDRYPHLQVIIGHLGETLPFMLPRLDQALPPELTGLRHPVSHYLRSRLYYSTSGFPWLPAFFDLFLQVGAERILFAADYPYATMTEACAFLQRLPVAPADRARIACGNAERLLRLSSPTGRPPRDPDDLATVGSSRAEAGPDAGHHPGPRRGAVP